MGKLRIAMLHLAPTVGDLERNRRQLENAVETAAGLGADWVLTPELCLSGYGFEGRIGTQWIVAQPDAWMLRFRHLVARHRLTVFLAHAERDSRTDKLHNTVFVIGPDGGILGTHRKVQIVPGAEDWASAGETIAPIVVPPLRVGVLICADAYLSRFAAMLHAQGAELLLSPAAWPPFPHAPQEAWEARSRETGLPLLVCNRGGSDDAMCFDDAQSVVVCAGKRVLVHRAAHSTLLLFDWNLDARVPVDREFRQVRLHESGTATMSWPNPVLA